jgi:anti-sigma factor RsiW
MTCDREKLSYYVDGELDPDEVRQLQQHLADCEQCQADLAAFRQVNDALSRLPQDRAPSELRRLVYHGVEERRRARLRWGWAAPLVGPTVPLTAGFFVLVGGILVWRTLSPSSSPVMTAAFAVQQAPDTLDGLRVELVFDRAVAADSVAQGIAIDPPLAVSQNVSDNKVELVPEEPMAVGSSYRVTVSNVRDQRGNVQSEPVVFSLTVGPTARLVQESSPGDLAPPATTVVQAAVPAARASTAASLLQANRDLGRQLGASVGPEREVMLSEQAFQGGEMLYQADTDTICALVRSNGRWLSFPNTWRPGEVLAPAGPRPPGTFEPLRGFGKVWRDQPSVKLQLGWPVYEDRSANGTVQAFEHGALVRTADAVAYALFDDGTWRVLPDPHR